MVDKIPIRQYFEVIMNVPPIEQRRMQDYEAYEAFRRARLRDEATEDLGFLALQTALPGLIDKREAAPVIDPAIERAAVGSIEHSLGSRSVHELVRIRPTTQEVFAHPERVALGYTERQAA